MDRVRGRKYIRVRGNRLFNRVDPTCRGIQGCAQGGSLETAGTVWPVLTELMYPPAEIPRAKDVVGEMILRGVIRILPLDAGDMPRIREVMRKYADRLLIWRMRC
jgi:hypothetical protein